MIDQPAIIQTAQRHIACIRLTIPRKEMMSAFGPAIQELVAALGAQGAPPAEPAFAHHFRITPETFDFEVGFATSSPVRPVGRVKPGVWPAQRAARTIYHGPYEGLPGAWGEFTAWMKAKDLRQADDLWEQYSVGPHATQDPAAWRTELTRPLV